MLHKCSQRTVKCDRCGEREFYWAHDTEAAYKGRVCYNDACAYKGQRVSFVMINRDGTPHTRQQCEDNRARQIGREPVIIDAASQYVGRTTIDAATLDHMSEPERSAAIAAERAAVTPSADDAAVLIGTLQRLLGSAVDEDKVR